MFRTLVLVAGLVLVLPACDAAVQPSSSTTIPTALTTTAEPASRTYFESLDLETPEAAAGTFTDAFRRDDYMTVWLVLHPEAQFAFQSYFNLMEYDLIVDTSRFDLSAGLANMDPKHWETGDQWWFFDQLMLAAARNGALLVDLHGEVTLREPQVGPGSAIDIGADVDGVEETVTIRLLERSGRWRVLQVIVPGGDEELLPWSVPD